MRGLFAGADSTALHLLRSLLEFDPTKRITVDQALRHSFLSDFYSPETESIASRPLDAQLEMMFESPENLKETVSHSNHIFFIFGLFFFTVNFPCIFCVTFYCFLLVSCLLLAEINFIYIAEVEKVNKILFDENLSLILLIVLSVLSTTTLLGLISHLYLLYPHSTIIITIIDCLRDRSF